MATDQRYRRSREQDKQLASDHDWENPGSIDEETRKSDACSRHEHGDSEQSEGRRPEIDLEISGYVTDHRRK
jgi:hypothetical protein